MRIYKIKQVANTIGLSKKEIKSILLGMQIITASWAVKEDQDLVVELNVFKGKNTLTTPFITEKGVNLLREISTAKESNVIGFAGVRVITQGMVNKMVDHLFGEEESCG